MCDLKFLGKIITHRKTEGHQRLKRFLHPKCDYCCQEFPSRMEWVDHRFTPDHLRKIKEILDSRTKAEDGAPIDEESPELDNDPLLEESLQTEDENPVLELADVQKDFQNRIPAYKPSREVAKNNVQPLSGFYCDICIRFMTSEAAAQEHQRTEKHYSSFMEAAKKQFKRLSDEENAKKRKLAEEEEGSATKKVKTDESAEDAAEANAEDGEGNGGDMYDPEEACQDNEASLDNATLDEEFAEVDRIIKTVEEEQVKEEVKKEEPPPPVEEKKPAPETASPRGRRAVAAKSGGGPRNKARRGGASR